VVPRPADLTGKFVKILASDERFQIQDLGTLLPMVQMRKDAPPKPKTEAVPSSIVTNREKFLSSVDTFLRARGTPISVQQLAQAVPRPDLTGKLITILASDARFQIQDLGSSVPMVQMRQPAPSIAKVRARWLSSVDAFLRARGTPISVGLLGKECPRPAELTGKFITILASDARFRLEGLESSVPMVGMRTTPPKSKEDLKEVQEAVAKFRRTVAGLKIEEAESIAAKLGLSGPRQTRNPSPPKRAKSPKTERWAECPTDAPFPALVGKGKWLPSAEVTQRKSFGKFCCFPCRKTWTSAHAYSSPDYQQCQACKLKLPAMWRWQTPPGTDRSEEEEEDRPERDPHRQELCSVCIRKGGPCWY